MWLEKTLDILLLLIHTVFYSVALYNTYQETLQRWCMSILSTRFLFFGLNHRLICSVLTIPLISPSSTHWYLCKEAVPKILGSPVDLFGFRGCSTIFGQLITLGGWKGSQCRDYIVRGNYSRRSSISSPVISWTTTCSHILYILLFSLQQDTYAQ